MRHWLALLVLSASCAAPARPPAASATTLRAQTVVTLAGERTDLGHVTEGRVALVSLWAPWCDACKKEIDALNRLASRTADRHDAMVVGVAVGESVASVDAFRRHHDMSYVQLVDEDFSLADALGQRRVPATLVIDRGGRIVYRGDVLDGEGLAAFRGALKGEL
jgi:thiol-disulfide isomerase/thioredoxin